MRRRKELRIQLILVLGLISVLGFAQSNPNPEDYLPKIIPPSPQAFTLGTYGNTPVGLFTGSPNLKILLLTFKTNNLNIPFEISYSSNGIKVDEVNSKVGLGWNLIGEGIITRVIRDQPDENDTQIPKPSLGVGGYSNPEFLNYFQTIGENPEVDSESDLFNYNFNNYSGKFVVNENGVVTLPKSDLKIEPFFNPLSPDMFNFKITSTDGVIYYFEEKEQTMLRTSGEGHPEPSMNHTAWYLTKIVHPLGDEIYFTYISDGSYYIASESQQLSKSYPSYQYQDGESYTKPPTFSVIYSHHTRIVGKKISTIYSNNPMQGSIHFLYEAAPFNNGEPNTILKEITLRNQSNDIVEKAYFNYLTTANNRVFLEQLSFKDIYKKYFFEYVQPQNLPLRLSKSQDHWGYYNGANNTHLMPQVEGYGFENVNYSPANKEPNSVFSQHGLLKKIIYPTKGWTEINYEANAFNGLIRNLPSAKDLTTLDVNTNEDIFTAQSTHQLKVLFDQKIEINGDSYFYNCESSMNVGENKHKSVVSVFCIEDNSLVPLFMFDQYGMESSLGLSVNVKSSAGTFYYRAQKDKNYTITIKNNFNCTRGYIGIRYYKENHIESYQNISTGGNRVHRSIDYNFDSTIADSKVYFYSKIDQLNISSGDKGAAPFYLDFRTFRKTSTTNSGSGIISYKEFHDLVITSSSLSNLYNNGSSVFYKYVSISHGGNDFEKGGEEKEFVVNRDYQGNPIYSSKDIRSAPYTNFGWNNGLEINSKVFKKFSNSLSLISQTENTYTKDDSKTIESTNYSSRKNFDNILSNNVVYICTSADVVKQYFRNICTTNHQHHIWMHNYHCIAWGANNKTVITSEHACFGLQPNDIVTYTDQLQNIDIVAYKNISYAFHLNSTKNTDFFYDSSNMLTGSIVNTKTFNYLSPSHINLTSQTFTTSNTGEVLETKYFYPQDPEMINEPFRNEMISKNMIGMPLDTQTFKAGEKISEKKTVYDKSVMTSNLLLPYNIYAKIGIGTIENTDKKVTYNQYDTNGNLLQYTPENGSPVSIIWGYNKTLPIAKVENIAYDNISASYITNAQSSSNTGSESSLLADLSILRNSLPDTSKATFYSYKPLIGVSTITDPKGYTTYYEYDSFNRLKYIKDKNLNILQRNCYNYRGQVIDCSQIGETTYNSTAKSGTFTRNNCAAGETGSSVIYNVTAGAYTSTISQADADSNAQEDVNSNGQTYANTNGNCTAQSVSFTYNYTFNPDSSQMTINVYASSSGHNGATYNFRVFYTHANGSSRTLDKSVVLAAGQTNGSSLFSLPSETVNGLQLLSLIKY